MAARAFLFDLDGTIWDSYPWYASAIAERSKLDPQVVLARLRQGDSIVSLLRRYRVSERSLFSSRQVLDLFPFVRETLGEFSNRRVPLAAVTNLPGRLAHPMLASLGLRSRFLAVIHAGNCRTLKPHPRPIRMALSELKVPADETAVFVGDGPHDAEAAERAGIAFAWASYGYGTARPRNAKYVLDRFSELLEL